MDDISLISQVVVAERQYRVRFDDRIADCYWPDATVATSWQAGPLSSYIGQDSAEVDPDYPIVANFSAPVVHLSEGDRAYVELPTMTRMRMVVNGVLAEIESFRRLIYYVERREGTWKIARMVSINETDNLRPVVPGTDLGIRADDLAGNRSSYQFLSYVRLAAGGSISDDLLGVDRPDGVAKVYADAEAWLAA
jgi:hypothetical protein